MGSELGDEYKECQKSGCLSMVACVCTPNTLEAEARRLQVQCQPKLHNQSLLEEGNNWQASGEGTGWECNSVVKCLYLCTRFWVQSLTRQIKKQYTLYWLGRWHSLLIKDFPCKCDDLNSDSQKPHKARSSSAHLQSRDSCGVMGYSDRRISMCLWTC